MNQISLDAKGGQFLADLSNWQRESAPDNSADLERLRRALPASRCSRSGSSRCWSFTTIRDSPWGRSPPSSI